uniref:Uncharacterized protein n=1 Tax=Aegilops tauschii subsp. strangulata TaxID=200361 RepID=A0A453C0Z9_AEGTS
MDLLSGRVVHGCSPSWRGVKSLRFPPLLGSWAAGSSAFPGCSCALAVCRNGSAVVPFAKKKRKGYSVEPPDGEETKDGASDEIEGMVEDVDGEEEGGDEEDAGDDGNAFLYSGDVSLLSFPPSPVEGWRNSVFSLHFFHHCTYYEAFGDPNIHILVASAECRL